ncbi:MAG: nucleotidyltransferase domain-containing protein [Spirochaetaceae bacterium]|nr:MAG: nucleotidyltransferase domain-containing protein [Spirochaetaceae bacterium]
MWYHGTSMQPMSVDRIIQDIVARLSDLPINRVVLFGSSSDGVRHPDSDIDLVIDRFASARMMSVWT